MKVVEGEGLTKWYGEVMGLNRFTAGFGEGITGLVGPNGAGKSTFLKLVTGQLRPDEGTLRVLQEDPWNNRELMARIGYCPEHNRVYAYLTGLRFVSTLLRLSGYSAEEANNRAEETLRLVGLEADMNRPLAGYSKGMRQRAKLAQALAHEPRLLLLDEPLNGTDPVGRARMIDVIKGLPDRGTSVLVSSHILFEVEKLTEQVVLINRGKAIASGGIREIRRLIDEHPHTVRLTTPRARDLARRLATENHIAEMSFDGEDALVVRTRDPETFYRELPGIVVDSAIPVHALESPDDNLEAVFRYLVE
ncbi:MAG: ABC transporter ATP-binding protein [Thermoplasmata archaeon]